MAPTGRATSNVVGDVGSHPVFSAPTTRSLSEGCLMYIDGGGVYRGYWSDYCRMMVIFRASDAQNTAYQISNKTMEAAIAAARPGNTAGDIARAVQAVVESETGPTETGIGRVGHGIGLEMPEPPSRHPEDEAVLRPGMVLCLEPNFELPGVGFLVAEEQVVITEDGCELLSRRAPAELPVV